MEKINVLILKIRHAKASKTPKRNSEFTQHKFISQQRMKSKQWFPWQLDKITMTMTAIPGQTNTKKSDQDLNFLPQQSTIKFKTKNKTVWRVISAGISLCSFMRKLVFLVSGIKYCIMTVYPVSRPHAELPFLPWKPSHLLLLFPFGLKTMTA